MFLGRRANVLIMVFALAAKVSQAQGPPTLCYRDAYCDVGLGQTAFFIGLVRVQGRQPIQETDMAYSSL